MASTYEDLLASYEDWPHDKPSPADMAAAGFYYQPCTKDVTTCSKCGIALAEWESNDNPLKKHSRYATCAWVEEHIAKAEQAAIEAKEAAAVTQKTMEQEAVAAPKPSSKAISSKSSKSDPFTSDLTLPGPGDTISRPIRSPPRCKHHENEYEERLATFTKWPHTSPTPESLAAAGFCFEPGTKDLTTCSECGLGLSNWRPKRDPMKAHMRQSPNCLLAQSLVEKETSSSAPAELAPTNCIASSPQTPYLTIEDLYHKQKALLAKAEEELEARVLEIKAYLEELEMLDAKEAAEQAAVQAKEAAAAAQKAMEQEAAAAEEAAKQAVMEAAKPEACPKDIGFFDPTMMVDLPELHLSANCASFLQNLGEQAAKYQESSVLKALQTSLRGPALIWFKDQAKFTSLDSFKTALAKAFPPAAPAEANPDPVIINPSPRFHSCPECAAQFSSISRLLAHAQKGCNKAFTCKHCEQGFDSNNKLHEHVRLNHSKTSAKTLGQRFAEGGSKHINLPVTSAPVMALTSPPVIPPISSTTSRSMSASARSSHLSNAMVQAQAACPKTPPAGPPTTSTNLAAPAPDLGLAQDHKPPTTPGPKASLVRSKSDYPITPPTTSRSTSAIPEPSHQPITMVKAPVNCPLTPPPTRPQTPVISHQKSPKSYMTMEDLFAMFAGKRSRKSLDYIHKRMRSPMPGQAKITSYFKPAGQPNPTSANSFKPSPLTSCPRPAPRASSPANQVARTPQYQHIAADAISNLGIQRRPKAPRQEYMADAGVIHTNGGNCVERPSTIAEGVNAVKPSIKSSVKPAYPPKAKWPKSSPLTSCPCPALRPCPPPNQTTGFPQYQHIAAGQTPSLENQPKANMQPPCQSPRQKYLVDAGVTHTNLGIRVGTTLTEAGGYKLAKSLTKSSKPAKLSKELKFSTCTGEPSSILRPWHPANQDARTPHIAAGRTMGLASSKSAKLIKSPKSAVFASSPCPALRSSLPANHDLVTPQVLTAIPSLLQALRALIKLADLPDLRASAASDTGTSPPQAPPIET